MAICSTADLPGRKPLWMGRSKRSIPGKSRFLSIAFKSLTVEYSRAIPHREGAQAVLSPPRRQCEFKRLVTVGTSSLSCKTLGEMLSTPAAASERIDLDAAVTSPAVMGPEGNSSTFAGSKSSNGRRSAVGAGAFRIRW